MLHVFTRFVTPKQVLLAVWLVGFTGWAYGQRPLSLSEAIAIGLENNYDILIEEGGVDITTLNNQWGEAGRWPTLNLFLDQGNSLRDVENAAAFLQGTTYSNNVTPSAQLTFTIFDGFRVRTTKERLDKLQREAEGNLDIVVQNTLQAIILGYYRAVYEQEQIEVLEKTLTVSRDKYNYVLLKKELGSAVTTEVLLEENNYLTDSLNLMNQQLIFRNAVRDLNVLMGVSEMFTSYRFTEPLEFEVPDYVYDDLLIRVNGSNVNLRRQYITQSVLRDNIDLAKADRYPSLFMTALASNEYNWQNLENAEFAFPNPNRELRIRARTISANLGFGISYTLFNGGRINRAIKTAKINYDIANIQTESLKLSLSRDLASEYDLFTIRKQLKGIAARREVAAEQNLLLSEEQYRSGTITSFDYRTVQLQYLNAALGNLEAIYNLIESNVNLLRLTGGIVNEIP